VGINEGVFRGAPTAPRRRQRVERVHEKRTIAALGLLPLGYAIGRWRLQCSVGDWLLRGGRWRRHCEDVRRWCASLDEGVKSEYAGQGASSQQVGSARHGTGVGGSDM
jgi:hypothetical protein